MNPSDPAIPAGGDVNNGWKVIVINVGLAAIPLILVVVRLIARKRLSQGIWWDDWAILAALVGLITGAGLHFVMVYNYGLGRHRYYLPPQHFQQYQKYQYGEWIQFIWTTAATQVSVCLFPLRLHRSPQLHRLLWGLICIILLSNLTLVFLWIFQCIPVHVVWSGREGRGCFSTDRIHGITLAHGAICTITDFMLALSPLASFQHVHITLPGKLALCTLGGLGLLTAACAMVRTIFSWETVATDGTWLIATYVWRGAEVNLGIALACLPTVPHLCRLLVGRHPPTPQAPMSSSPRTAHTRPRRPSEPWESPIPEPENFNAPPSPASSASSLPEYRIPIKHRSVDMATKTTSDTVVNENFPSGSLQDTSWLDVPHEQPDWSKAWLATDSNASTT